MIPLSLDEIAAIVGGDVVDAEASLDVSGPAFIDSRAPERGGLFVAFEGEQVDGHDYAASAVESGAAERDAASSRCRRSTVRASRSACTGFRT